MAKAILQGLPSTQPGLADQLGATKMDRPKNIETNPVNGKVYCVMTNNNQRTAAQVDAPNPRANNVHG